MIYYNFSKFQPIYCKRALRSTIPLSLYLCRKPPGFVPIAAWGPWSRFLSRGVWRAAIQARGGLPGDEERVGEYEGRESYLRVVSVDAGVAGGGPSAGAGAWRRRWRRGAAVRRGWASRDGLGTFSGPRGTRSGARLERRWSGGEGRRGAGAPGGSNGGGW
jgi:hypothetical protein